MRRRANILAGAMAFAALVAISSFTSAWGQDVGFTDSARVSDDVLARLRGGFQPRPTDPFLSFGIERNVYVNGKLMTSLSLNIPNIGDLAAVRTTGLPMVQNGPGNVVQAGLLLPTLMAVVQNTLDNQNIRTETIINATVPALSLMKSLNLAEALSQSTFGGLRR